MPGGHVRRTAVAAIVLGALVVGACSGDDDDSAPSTTSRLAAECVAKQPVLRITPCAEHGTGFDLTRAAYHLGNRHVPIELQPDHLKIEPDHVLADLLRSMHLIVNPVEEPFEPEGGAYAAAAHEHAHGHGHHAH